MFGGKFLGSFLQSFVGIVLYLFVYADLIVITIEQTLK